MYIATIVLFSCFLTAVSNIFLKKGLRTSNPSTAMLFSLFITWVVLGILTFFFALESPYTQTGVLIYLVIGMFAPLIVRYFTYKGIDLLGAARTSPIRSFTPLFAYFFAVIFLKEDFNPPVFIGSILIILGAVGLSKEEKDKGIHQSKTHYFIYPITAAVLAGIATNLRKFGFDFLESPILAAFLTASSAFVLFMFTLFIFKQFKNIKINRNSTIHFSLSSFCTAGTILLTLFSLKHAKVTLVAPLLATIPLFTLLLSIVFLKKEEKITRPMIISTVVVFLGIQLVLFFIDNRT